MWTGRQICSEYLEVSDAIKFKDETSKQPFYWDNYPVNDVAMIHQLHVGPIEKREKQLGEFSVGLVANPMDRFESSLLPLATIADYLWDAEGYEAQDSWDWALRELISQADDRHALRHLFRNCFESCLAVDAAPDFGAVLSQATFAWRTGQAKSAAKLLDRYANEALRNFEIASSKEFSWPEIQPEIAPWLAKYKMVAEALISIAKILEATTFANGRINGSVEMAEQVRNIRISLAQNPTRIFGDGLDLVLGELATELSAA
jgi:hyaluronoglucosaminidase